MDSEENDEDRGESGSNPCGAICFGVVLFVVGLSLGGWNEYRNVATMKSISQGRDNVVAVSCSPIDTAHTLNLIHLSCPLTGHAMLGAEYYGMGTGEYGLRLTSEVEVYQWEQVTVTKGSKDEKRTVKEWQKKWRSSYDEGRGPQSTSNLPVGLQSTSDLLSNPPLSSQPWWHSRLRFGRFTAAEAPDIMVGAFAFPSDLLSSVVSSRAVNPNCALNCPEGVYAMGDTLHFKFNNEPVSGPDKIGDMRQTFHLETADFASVLARQSAGGQLVPWPSSYDKDYTIFLATDKAATADEMFTSAEEDNAALTWALRLITCICTCAGIFFLLQPLSIIASWVPCIGPLLGDLVEMVVCGVACAIGSMCWLMVAGFVWVAYRPYIGIPLLLVSCGLAGWLFFLRGKGMERKKFDLESAPDDEGKEMEERPMNFCGQCGARKPVDLPVCRACADQE